MRVSRLPAAPRRDAWRKIGLHFLVTFNEQATQRISTTQNSPPQVATAPATALTAAHRHMRQNAIALRRKRHDALQCVLAAYEGKPLV